MSVIHLQFIHVLDYFITSYTDLRRSFQRVTNLGVVGVRERAKGEKQVVREEGKETVAG